MLIDSHAHLDDQRLKSDLEGVLQRAGEAGVIWVITMGTCLASSRIAVELAHRFPMVAAAVGVHPHEAETAPDNFCEELAQLARDSRVVAIGEIGLDYHYNFSPPEVQRKVFKAQLRLAEEMGLPAVIHDREAHHHTEEILTEFAPTRGGVIHCFSGDAALAVRLVERGFYLSFAGPVTFKGNAEHYRSVLSAIPRGRFLLETDCPYLSPAPFRGKCNEPARVRLVAGAVAGLLGVPEEEVVREAGEATANLFNLNQLEFSRRLPI